MKTIIAVATLAAASLSLKQPIQRGPVKVGLLLTDWEGSSAEMFLFFNGTQPE